MQFISQKFPLEMIWRSLPTGRRTLCLRKEFGEITTQQKSWTTIASLGTVATTLSMVTAATACDGVPTEIGRPPGLRATALCRPRVALVSRRHRQETSGNTQGTRGNTREQMVLQMVFSFGFEAFAQTLSSKEEIESLAQDGPLSRIQTFPIHFFS